MKNAIFSIRPYKYQGMWVFDDERVDLVKEPFVMGIPEIIDELVKDFPNPEDGVTVLFSSTGLPSPDAVLVRQHEEAGGNWLSRKELKDPAGFALHYSNTMMLHRIKYTSRSSPECQKGL